MTVSLLDPNVVVVPGESITISFDIVGPQPSAATVGVLGLPANVTASAPVPPISGFAHWTATLTATTDAPMTTSNALVFATAPGFDRATTPFAISVSAINGSLDPSFGSGGFVSLSASLATGIVTSSHGTLVAITVPSSPRVGVTRLTDDGSVDTTFGTNGTALAQFEGSDQSDTLAIASDESLVVGTDKPIDTYFEPVGFLGFSANGSPTTSTTSTTVTPIAFSGTTLLVGTSNGLVSYVGATPTVSPTGFVITAMAAASDGSIIAGSSSAMHRFLPAGNGAYTLDPTYAPTTSGIAAVVLDDQNRAVVVANPFQLVRVDTSGNVDSSFGGPIDQLIEFCALVRSSNGYVVVGTGASSIENTSVFVSRFTASGQIDSSFGVFGTSMIAPPHAPTAGAACRGAAADAQGRTLILIDAGLGPIVARLRAQ
jgi:hypothetical protein